MALNNLNNVGIQIRIKYVRFYITHFYDIRFRKPYYLESNTFSFQELTPLIFCFELPNVGTLQSFPELTSPFILEVQETYNVQVMFRTRAKLHSTLVMVKGCEWEVIRVKEATVHLIKHMCGSFAVRILNKQPTNFSLCLVSSTNYYFNNMTIRRIKYPSR